MNTVILGLLAIALILSILILAGLTLAIGAILKSESERRAAEDQFYQDLEEMVEDTKDLPN